MCELVWCGGVNEGQDVTIRLVLPGLSQNGSNETLQLLKVHSSHLRRCSKYFETCLSERWSAALSNADARCDVEFSLEVHGDLACYRDCFSQMYSSYRKDIRSVEYGLALLRVASQIEYRDLMDSVVRYLSAIAWSDEDETMIREYSSSPDFPRNCAGDLVVRLGLDEVEEESRKNMYGVIEIYLHRALEDLGTSSGDFIESLLKGIESERSSSFAKTVIGIVIKVAKEMFEKLSVKDRLKITSGDAKAINWILTVLLNAGLAEELVERFVHIKSIPEFLSKDGAQHEHQYRPVKRKTERVVIRIYQEVASGRLPLRTAERVALFKNWFQFLMIPDDSRAENGEAIKKLFSTLPSEVQIECVQEYILHLQIECVQEYRSDFHYFDFMESIESERSSSFAKTVIGIVMKVAKEMFEKLSVKDRLKITSGDARAINWILTVLLNAGLAEELVERFVHIKSIPEFLSKDYAQHEYQCRPVNRKTERVVIRIYQEVASGRLPLRTAERVALLKNWFQFLMLIQSDSRVEYGEAIKNLFSTLPCEVQIECVQEYISDFDYFVDPSSLAKLVKKTLTAPGGTKSRPSLEGPSRQRLGRRDEGEDKERMPAVNDGSVLRKRGREGIDDTAEASDSPF